MGAARRRPARGARGPRGAGVPSLTGRVALAVIDPQRLFCDPCSPAYLADWPAARMNALALVAAFRGAGSPVLVTAHRAPPGRPDPAFDALFSRRLAAGDPLSALTSPFDELPAEHLLIKPRFSLFSAPGAEESLAGIGFLIVCGVTTNLCVLASCLDAAARGIVPVVAADACAARSEELHAAALTTIASGHGFVAATAAILAALPWGGATP